MEALCKKINRQLFDRRRQLVLIRKNRDATDAISQVDIELRGFARDRQDLVDLKQAAESLLNEVGANFAQVKRQYDTVKLQKQQIQQGVAQVAQEEDLWEPAPQQASTSQPQLAQAKSIFKKLDPVVSKLMEKMDVNE